MDLEGFFLRKNKYHHRRDVHKYYSDGNNRYNSNHNYQEKFNPFELVNNIRNNRKLKTIIMVILVFIVVLIIGLIALLFPVISNILNYISQNGVSGIIEMVMEFLNNLWNGAN